MEASERRFLSMGCGAHVIVDGGSALLDLAQERLADLESRWSRFISTSDLTRLNDHAGSPISVHPDTMTLVRTMLEAHELTRGGFDPTVLPSLVMAGYRSSRHDPNARTVLRGGVYRSGAGMAGVVADAVSMTVTLPEGVAIDPGGIGKGLAADLVVRDLAEAGAESALVNVGGDMSILGVDPRGHAWTVTIENPLDSNRGSLGRIGVPWGGVATSSTVSRVWVVEGESRHHLIDPRTSSPVKTSVAQVTVLASTAWLAEAIAGDAIISGGGDPLSVVKAAGCSGVAVSVDGSVECTDDVSKFWTRTHA